MQRTWSVLCNETWCHFGTFVTESSTTHKVKISPWNTRKYGNVLEHQARKIQTQTQCKELGQRCATRRFEAFVMEASATDLVAGHEVVLDDLLVELVEVVLEQRGDRFQAALWPVQANDRERWFHLQSVGFTVKKSKQLCIPRARKRWLSTSLFSLGVGIRKFRFWDINYGWDRGTGKFEDQQYI